jgi:hypothetical protein
MDAAAAQRRSGRVRRRLPHASDEGGQVLVIAAVSMVFLLCCVGLVVDVGHAMLVQRQLQAGVDAGALAGVQHLPDAAMAETVARQFGPSPGSKNSVNTVNNAATTAKTSCLAGVPGCNRRDGGVNGITVEASSKVPTWFGRIIGINHMNVSAKATACSPCQVKPLDIMIVLDRTGSMCRTGSGGYERPTCPDMKNARDGIKTFLGMMDPSIDKVGLALTPPVLDASWISSCKMPNGYLPWTGTSNPNAPPGANYNGKFYGLDAYWPSWDLTPPSTPSVYTVASLEGADGIPADDYLINDPVSGWMLNPLSALVQRLDCAGAEGSTSYALAVEEAQHELDAHGRGNVQDVVVFLGDGAANSSPMSLPSNHWTNNPTNQATPCGTAVQSAQRLKDRGTVVYTIGYDLNGAGTDYERCLRPDANGHQQASTPANYEACNPALFGCNAWDAIRAMATSPQHFYNKPTPGQLNDIFRAIAIDLSGSRARLIDNTSPNLIG